MWLFNKKPAQEGKAASKRPASKAVQRVHRMLGHLSLPVIEADPEMRYVVLPVKYTYHVKLYAWPSEDSRVCLVTSIDYRVDRDFILRELALELLEENHALQDEAFVLIPRADNDRLIGCRRVMSLAKSSDAELITACTSLIQRMDRVVARIYSKGLIPSGPSTIRDHA